MRSVARVLLLSLLCAGPALAQQSAPAPSATAPVKLDGVTLFALGGVQAYPAAERARAVSERIEALASDASVAPEAIQVTGSGEEWSVEAAGRLLVETRRLDADRENASRKTLARAYALRIASAVVEYRRERTGPVLKRKALALATSALAAAVGLVVAFWLLRRLEAVLERRLKPHLRDVGVQAFQVVRAEQLWAAVGAVLRGARRLSLLIGFFLLARFALHLYPWTRSLGVRLDELVLGPLTTLGAGVAAIAPDLAFLAIWAFVARYTLSLVRVFFAALAGGSVSLRGFDPEWAEPTHKIVRLLLIVFALIVAFPYIPGSDSEAFRGASIFLGVLFSLGSSSLIGNVIAGYTLVYRRTFRVGDRIRVGDAVGDVIESRLLVTHLRTPKNEEVIVPNSQILQGSVINYSSLKRQQKLILYTPVGIGYETPWRQVEAMLLTAAARTTSMLREPPPFVLLRALGDFAVTYELNVHTDDPNGMARQYAELHRHILDVFNEHAVQIMTPAYEGDPAQPKIVPKEQWFAAPASAPRE